MKLVIVSGTSGAGKSTALQALEDGGYYCIDNLPVALLPQFAEQIRISSAQHGYETAAVGVDARNLSVDFSDFPQMLNAIRAQGLVCEVIFLDADTDTLLKRFSETRRRHPLTWQDTPLREAIEAERILLMPIHDNADWSIDTSRMTIHQLRDMIRTRLQPQAQTQLSLLFLSFGYKYGLPQDADFVFDVRCLPNPHWDPALRSKTGLDPEVRSFLGTVERVTDMGDQIFQFLSLWLPCFEKENRSYITIAIGCTGGQHRSVYLADRLGELFRSQRSNILVRHRELV